MIFKGCDIFLIFFYQNLPYNIQGYWCRYKWTLTMCQ